MLWYVWWSWSSSFRGDLQVERINVYRLNISLSIVFFLKSYYDIGDYMPYKDRYFNTRKLGKCFFILLFVWLVVIGFRQNYFHILLNFGDFGAKTSFYLYIINQKLKMFITYFSPVFQNTTYIRNLYLCIYICISVFWVLEHGGGGGRCSTD